MRSSLRSRGLPLLVLALSLAGGCASAARSTDLERFGFADPLMGSLLRVVCYAPDAATAQRVHADALARARGLVLVFSDYDAESEVRRLERRALTTDEPLVISPELADLLAYSVDLAHATQGAFDVTSGALVRLWRRARRRGEVPELARLQAARASCGPTALVVDRAASTATFTRDGTRLDLGAVAKGEVVDAVLRTFVQRGLPATLVDAGGDVAVGAAPPGRPGWRVRLETGSGPAVVVSLAHAAVATSGDRYQALEIGGERYSHIIDPRTGWALVGGVGATVIARSARAADAFATLLCVLGPQEGLAWLEERPGVEGRIATRTAGASHSSGFGRFLEPEPSPDDSPALR